MAWFYDKIQEILSNFWVKSIALIPVSMFAIEEKEKGMIITFTIVITVDCIFGAMQAKFCHGDFKWSLLGKKFSKKFLLYFFTMLTSFVISNAYDFMEYWFYVIGTIILFSEFFSLLEKAKMLGLPVDIRPIRQLNEKIQQKMMMLVGVDCKVPRKKRQRNFVQKRDIVDMEEQVAINTAKIITNKAKRENIEDEIADMHEEIEELKHEKCAEKKEE